MNKELYVSSTPHETRLALAEDGEVAEVYYEREKEYSLAGAIYKGRVTRVLPGMQSAFVDIGLERDAFLYVSDFFEDSEEYDRVVSEAENAVARLDKPAGASAVADAAPVANADGAAAPAPRDSGRESSRESGRDRDDDRRGGRRGGRQRGRRGGGRNPIPDSKFARPGDVTDSTPAGASADENDGVTAADMDAMVEAVDAAEPNSAPAPAPSPATDAAAFVLPGESLAKYRGASRPSAPPPPPVESSREPEPRPAPVAEIPAPVVAAPPPPPPAATASAYPAFVLPGETLAKYRNAPPSPPVIAPESAAPMAAPPEVDEAAIAIEAAPEMTASVAAEIAPPAVEPMAGIELHPDWADEFDLNAPVEEDFSAADDDSELDPDAPGAQSAEPNGNASASVRQDSGQARMQNPNRENRDGRDGRGGRGRGRRRRHRGGDRDPRGGDAREHRGGDARTDAASGDAPPPRELQRESRRDERRDDRHSGKNESGPNSRLIGDLLHEGQEILIQIAKEPLGKKGARITSHLALPGRFLVYMPTVSHIGVSRKISSDEDRARLKRLLLENTAELPGGFIVRTAAQAASDEEIKADIRLLANQWNDMRAQFEKVRSPALLHHDLNLVERTLRDQLSDEFSHIWVDTEDQYQRIVKFVSYFMPHLVSRVRLYTRDEPLFEHFGIQEEINKALKSKVWLKSGGYIVINQTEALVAIDVNTGKYVGKSNRLEDTIVKTNVDAIKEIVRQIRLRDLGGIIVIDFIDMDERRNRTRVMQALDEAMRADRSPNKVLAFNDFGLVALTRKRVKQSLERTLGTACPYCEGVGLVKSPTTICNEIYAEVRKLAPGLEREDIVLRVNPEVAKTLKERGGQRLREIEDLTRKAISVRPDPQKHQEQFEIY